MVCLDRPHGHYGSRYHCAYQLTNLTPFSTADAGTLVITADGTAMSQSIGVAVVLWDERGNPISVNSGMLTLSGWCKNAAGNYITANGYGTAPGFLAVDVLPRGRVHRARPVDHSQRQREPTLQALLRNADDGSRFWV